MACIVDLAKLRVNILDYRLYPEASHDLAFIEYPYKPADGSPRTWHKTVVAVEHGGDLAQTILDEVRELKAGLEN